MHSQIIRKQNGGTKEDHSWVHCNIMDHTYQPQVYGAGQKNDMTKDLPNRTSSIPPNVQQVSCPMFISTLNSGDGLHK